MEDIFEIELNEDQDEETRQSALDNFNYWKLTLESLKSCHPKEFKFCFNSRRDLDDLAYSYLNEENQKLLHH